MKLQKMTDFVLEQSKQPYTDGSKYKDIVAYAKFLQQPLTLGMFIPCDKTGNVLTEPTHFNEWFSEYKKGFQHEYEGSIMRDYLEAKEKVLFKGFNEESAMELMYYNDNVEQVANFNGFELTESALKKIGINDTSNSPK